MSANLTCPHCQVAFQSYKAPGMQASCPRCLKYFTVTAAPPAPAKAPAPPPTRIPQPVPPRAPAPAPVPVAPSSTAITLTVLAVLSVAAVALGAYVLAPKGDAAVAEAKPLTPNEPTSPQVVAAKLPVESNGSAASKAPTEKTGPATSTPPKTEPGLKKLESPIPGIDQQKINAAIERGVAYLRTQNFAKNKVDRHQLGHVSLAGLTFLESQVPADDPDVASYAEFVRRNAPASKWTYDISLAILFLDRLGDAQDRPLIQTLAFRLIAGQDDTAGWGYVCTLVSPNDQQALQRHLTQTRPTTSDRVNLDRVRSANAPRLAPKSSLPSAQKLPTALQSIPSVALSAPKKSGKDSDNSNTQFALLALWAARRNDVPAEKALLLADQRFETSQNGDGGWGYRLRNPTRHTMTCVGLLGLALGHGSLLTKQEGENPAPADAPADPLIQQGINKLGSYLGAVRTDPDAVKGIENLYLLWSVERVAMLYNLKTIGGKDWYGWGAQMLVLRQSPDGSFRSTTSYSPTVDTCFGLLFLNRSNLVQDLSSQLQRRLAITDPQSSGAKPE